MNMSIDFPAVVEQFDVILERGLCAGIGTRNGQMCVEAAICAALDLPHGDHPDCVSIAVRSFKISLNDSAWSSPAARAKGLRRLGIAQLGSRDVVNNDQFVIRLTDKIIRELIPDLYRRGATRFEEPHKSALLLAADTCASTGSQSSAIKAAEAAWAAGAAEAAWAAEAARAAEAAWATKQSFWEADRDYYFCFAANLAFQVLVDLKSPGALWLIEHEAQLDARDGAQQ